MRGIRGGRQRRREGGRAGGKEERRENLSTMAGGLSRPPILPAPTPAPEVCTPYFSQSAARAEERCGHEDAGGGRARVRGREVLGKGGSERARQVRGHMLVRVWRVSV